MQGQRYDGVAAMRIRFKGVQANDSVIKNMYPKALINTVYYTY